MTDKNPLNLPTVAETKYIQEIASRIDYKAELDKAVVHPGTIILQISVVMDETDAHKFRVELGRIARFSFTNLESVTYDGHRYRVKINIQRTNVREFDENDDYWERTTKWLDSRRFD